VKDKQPDTKCRLCRREGVKLYLKGERCFSPKCPIDKKGASAPGIHRFKTRKLSAFGQQLREKQKLKRTYFLREAQLKNYFKEALKKRGDTGEHLLVFLERRLDNIVYRSGLAVSRHQARQFVGHGWIKVDGRKITIPSFRVCSGQVISLSEKVLQAKVIKELLVKKTKLPSWLERKVHSVKAMRLPSRQDIGSDLNDQLIVEYYSR